MGKVITFAQQKGGAGKTTVLAHLAAAWAGAGLSVAMIDLDPQRSLTRWAKLRAEGPARARAAGLDLIESKDYRATADMRAAAKSHDYVLVDCPGAASSLLEAAVRESHLVVAPCQPSVMDVWATSTVIETAGQQKTPLRILLNRVPPRGGATHEVAAALGASKASLMTARLGNRVAFSQSMVTGLTAPEISGRSAAAAEVAAVQREIEDLLAGG